MDQPQSAVSEIGEVDSVVVASDGSSPVVAEVSMVAAVSIATITVEDAMNSGDVKNEAIADIHGLTASNEEAGSVSSEDSLPMDDPLREDASVVVSLAAVKFVSGEIRKKKKTTVVSKKTPNQPSSLVEEEDDEPEEPDPLVIELSKEVADIDAKIDDIQKTRESLANELKALGGTVSSTVRKSIAAGNEAVTKTMDGAGAHWDYLLKEMAWMSNDFRVERKWKVQSAKKLGKEAERVTARKEVEKKREASTRISGFRKQATKIAREVKKSFWNKVDRIVLFKNNAEYIAEQQQVMDRNLDRLLVQTERYTSSLIDTATSLSRKRRAAERIQEEEARQELIGSEALAISQLMRKYVEDRDADEPEIKRMRKSKKKNGHGGVGEKDDGGGESSKDGDVKDASKTPAAPLSNASAGSVTQPPTPVQPQQAREIGSPTKKSLANGGSMTTVLAQNVQGADEGDDDDASWNASSEEEQDDDDELVEEDNVEDDDGNEKNLADDLNVPLDVLIQKMYGIVLPAGGSSTPAEAHPGEGKGAMRKKTTKQNEAAATTSTSVAAKTSARASRNGNAIRDLLEKDDAAIDENGDDDGSWDGAAQEEEEDDDKQIDSDDERNPEDNGGADVLQAEMDIPLDELLAREYGISVEQLKSGNGETKKPSSSSSSLKPSKDNKSVTDVRPTRNRKQLAVSTAAAEETVEGEEEEDESWRDDESDSADDDHISGIEDDDADDDGNANGLEDDMNIPIEEILAKRYGISSSSTTSTTVTVASATAAASKTREEEGSSFRTSTLAVLLNDDMEVESAGGEEEDESFSEPSEDDEDDEETFQEAEATIKDDCTLADMKADAEMDLEELLKREYHGFQFETQKSPAAIVADETSSKKDDALEDQDPSPSKKKKKMVTITEDKQDETIASSSLEVVPSKGETVVTVVDETHEEEEDVPLPFLLSKERPLREYQREGLNWLVSLHDRQLNGILADEMGLGKTAQTIALLSHLAGSCNIWGPHLIVVPTSVILNWDLEFKNWCPALKVLTYFGTNAERAAKRSGWTKANSFHVCVTSYQLAVQDASVFKRKKWYYIICDEAHALKNSKSQRWQTLLSFQAKRRLLITGTPLQNSLMELWSLMHFLMPEVFRSQHEFKHWFSNPLQAMVEEGDKKNASAVKRLHAVMRPFILRRLKRDVATQLPSKYEHIVRLPLARRQRFLYEDFISLGSTQNTLRSGGYVGMMSVLMKLRMVCNHPDLFEPRLVTSSLCLDELPVVFPKTILDLYTPGIDAFPMRTDNFVSDREFCNSLSKFEMDKNYLPPWASLQSRQKSSRSVELLPEDETFLSSFTKCALGESVPHAWDVDFTIPSTVQSKVSQLYLSRVDKLMQEKAESADLVVQSNRRTVESSTPVFGSELIDRLRQVGSGARNIPSSLYLYEDSLEKRLEQLAPVLDRFVFVTPTAQGRIRLQSSAAERLSVKAGQVLIRSTLENDLIAKDQALLHPVMIRQRISFPDRFLIQYDCGKLQTLAIMLQRLKQGSHRVLIFTQMTRMLDILERFLNLHSHTYYRLDGSTKVEDRQAMMDRFNRDTKIFCFILSTRSGGLGINLTGADTVIFYDSDWNPSMDAQAQDRAHRIGQTRDVHIYRLVSEQSVEENILLKSNQKRHLNRLSVEDGQFSSLLFQQIDFTNEAALAQVEDETDRLAFERAKREELEDSEDVMAQADAVVAEKTVGETEKAAEGDDQDQDQGDDKIEDEHGNTLMTKLQYQELESKLKPIDLFAIDYRQKYFVVIDQLKEMRRQKELMKAQIIEEQTQDWEIETLEHNRKLAEQEAEEDLIADKDSKLTEAQAKAVYASAQRCHRLERKLRKMTGKAWHRAFERVMGQPLANKRPYYQNEDSNEISWERPRILDAERERRLALKSRHWSFLPLSALVRIARFTSPSDVFNAFNRVCTTWWKAVCANPSVCTFVENHPDSATSHTPTLTIGSAIEARHLGGEVWFPGTIVDVNGQDGSFSILYSDGVVEKQCKRALVRKDSGGRWTYVKLEKEGPMLEVLNPTLASDFGCGAPVLLPNQMATGMIQSLSIENCSRVLPIVLMAGTHTIAAASSEGAVMTVSVNVRVVGEVFWAKEKDSYNLAVSRVLPDEDPFKPQLQEPIDMTRMDTLDKRRASIISSTSPSKLSTSNLEIRITKGNALFQGLYFDVKVKVQFTTTGSIAKFAECYFANGIEVDGDGRLEMDGCRLIGNATGAGFLLGASISFVSLQRCRIRGNLVGADLYTGTIPGRSAIFNACDLRGNQEAVKVNGEIPHPDVSRALAESNIMSDDAGAPTSVAAVFTYPSFGPPALLYRATGRPLPPTFGQPLGLTTEMTDAASATMAGGGVDQQAKTEKKPRKNKRKLDDTNGAGGTASAAAGGTASAAAGKTMNGNGKPRKERKKRKEEGGVDKKVNPATTTTSSMTGTLGPEAIMTSSVMMPQQHQQEVPSTVSDTEMIIIDETVSFQHSEVVGAAAAVENDSIAVAAVVSDEALNEDVVMQPVEVQPDLSTTTEAITRTTATISGEHQELLGNW